MRHAPDLILVEAWAFAYQRMGAVRSARGIRRAQKNGDPKAADGRDNASCSFASAPDRIRGRSVVHSANHGTTNTTAVRAGRVKLPLSGL
jgi:hypothetical protein